MSTGSKDWSHVRKNDDFCRYEYYCRMNVHIFFSLTKTITITITVTMLFSVCPFLSVFLFLSCVCFRVRFCSLFLSFLFDALYLVRHVCIMPTCYLYFPWFGNVLRVVFFFSYSAGSVVDSIQTVVYRRGALQDEQGAPIFGTRGRATHHAHILQSQLAGVMYSF